MKIQKNRKFSTVALILLLALSAMLVVMPKVEAKTTITLSPLFYNFIGLSPTLISWAPAPAAVDPLLYAPAYANKTSVWPNATATFTRPDGSKDVVQGPFTARPSLVQGRLSRVDITLIYTPSMAGNWSVSFYWPGDDTYNIVNQTDTFKVLSVTIPKRDVACFLSMRPYPIVGLNQDLMINAWVTPPPMSQRDYFSGYTFTFTSPGGVSTKVGPMDSESPGTVWFDYRLTEIGNWTVRMDFPGDISDLPATVTRTIVVQKDAIYQGYPDTPLPTGYWTFPINVENREWRNVAGPWYQSYYNASEGSWNPYTEAPRTAHILWDIASADQIGGYIGSPHSIQNGAGEASYGAGDVGIYGATVPNIRTVMAGRAYYNIGTNMVCVDMKTGGQLWTVPGSFNVGAERGSTAVLYSFSSTRFIVYNAITGAMMLNVTGMAMTFFTDPYVYTSASGRIIKWTTTGDSTDFSTRIIWNITNPFGTPAGAQAPSNSFACIEGNYMVYKNTGSNNTMTALDSWQAIDLTTGQLVYNTPAGNPADPSTWVYRMAPAIGSGYGLVYAPDLPHSDGYRGYSAFDVSTGRMSWTSEQTDYPWGAFWAYMPQASGYGMIYGLGYTGVVAFNVTNGKIVWHYIDQDLYDEEPYDSSVMPNGTDYASYSFGSTGPVIGGGVVFAPNTEHSPTFFYRGQGLCAVDAFTGKQLWKIMGIYVPTAIAYGTLLASDSTNGFTYAFGKGQTATTISIADKTITSGTPVLIEGTVTDQSPAQQGTPAISDASMTDWMEYVHMQQPMPNNATGVPVHLTAIDPNGNFQDIGTAVSNTLGNYAISWTPPVPGLYTVTASFEGSNSYYSSKAGTAFLITKSSAATPSVSTSQPASSTPAPAQPTPSTPIVTVAPTPSPIIAPPTSGMPTTAYIAIAIAIVAIVAAAAALILRRRK